MNSLSMRGALALVAFVACTALVQADESGEIVAVVNGEKITRQDVNMFAGAAAARGQRLTPEMAQQALIERELLVQDAYRKGLDKNPAVMAQLKEATHALLARAAVGQLLQSNPPSDAELRKLYNDKVASRSLTEYKARHILVPTEEEAKNVIAELDKGADFSELAKSKSTGPSGPKGGDLGWFSPAQMVKPFSDATQALKKGSYSKTPVKTQFGWHVIQLDDTRTVAPPSFEDTKDRLLEAAGQQRIGAYLEKLRQAATIETP
ncbi:MAG TPA: peptidylprolyl isomerase [Gammaproteobacteria bacterium]|nr:peptidylprolyl isomerase [Gammaproteobacteria bacterium]